MVLPLGAHTLLWVPTRESRWDLGLASIHKCGGSDGILRPCCGDPSAHLEGRHPAGSEEADLFCAASEMGGAGWRATTLHCQPEAYSFSPGPTLQMGGFGSRFIQPWALR